MKTVEKEDKLIKCLYTDHAFLKAAKQASVRVQDYELAAWLRSIEHDNFQQPTDNEGPKVGDIIKIKETKKMKDLLNTNAGLQAAKKSIHHAISTMTVKSAMRQLTMLGKMEEHYHKRLSNIVEKQTGLGAEYAWSLNWGKLELTITEILD